MLTHLPTLHSNTDRNHSVTQSAVHQPQLWSYDSNVSTSLTANSSRHRFLLSSQDAIPISGRDQSPLSRSRMLHSASNPTAPSPFSPSSTFSPPPPSSTSAASAWLQSVTSYTQTYITSTISLSNSSSNANGLVAHETLSGIQVDSSNGSNSNNGSGTSSVLQTFENDVSYVTSMQDLLYTLFVAALLMVALVVAHAGMSRTA